MVKKTWGHTHTYPVQYLSLNHEEEQNYVICSDRWTYRILCFSSVQSLHRVWLSATPWTAAHQASLSITNSRSLLKLMSITSVMPSNLARERQTLYDITYMWHLKNNTNEYIDKTETHRYIKPMSGDQKGEERRRGKQGVWD